MQKNPVEKAYAPAESGLRQMVMLWLYRALLMLILLVGIAVYHVLPFSLTTCGYALVLLAYLGLLTFTQRIYKACEIGITHLTELIMSQFLSNLFCMGIAYCAVVLYAHQFFNPLPLLLVMAAQDLLSIFWSIWANRLYFKHYCAPATAIIYKNQDLLDKLCKTPFFDTHYHVVKLIPNPPDDIAFLQKELDGCSVVFTLGIPATLTNGIAKLCVQEDITGYFVPHLGHIIMNGAEYQARFNFPLLRVQRAGGYSEFRGLKRIFDLFAALVGIVLTAPIMLFTALAIYAEDHGPVLYRQERLTKDGKHFQILKFRSMNVNAEQDGIARLAGENDSRITKVGHFIRACRIDELPQLFNILRGDMSIVGPRPERPEIAAQYEEMLPEFKLRLQVKAGLTGVAQVYGRYNTDPYSKLQMDLMYLNDMSFLKDLQLILATVKILFMKDSTEGIAQGQHTAMSNNANNQQSAG